MEFEKRKAAALGSLSSTESDKSPKGSLDTAIIPLINTLNQNPSYFTTSSCSGRISILSQPLSHSQSPNPKKKARGGSWLFVSHHLADPDSVLSLPFPSESTHSPVASELVFRFEPLIIALECRDLDSAHSLVSLAISCGFRESGITNAKKRVIIAIRCSIRMEVPLGDTRNVMVTPEYVRYLLMVANEKMEANWKRTQRFLQVFQSTGSVVADNSNHLSSANEACDHLELEDESRLGNGNAGTSSGIVGSSPGSGLSIDHFEIVGEPVEKLFLWGHSACALDDGDHKKVAVFGGFGGMGRHARRNYLLLLDPYLGNLEMVSTVGCASPSPRLGHTASLVGDHMFVIGGRTGPDKILSDVWILDTTKNSWKLLQFGDDVFPPRHRHAAAVVGSNIYVFGGLDNDVIFSSFYVFDTNNLHWKEIPVSGDRPCARHSHAMVASDSQIFVFGGYNGGKALGDLYSFDVQKCQWTKEITTGRNPHSRFSHSIFVYKNYLGVLGGCPVRQHCQELALLDLKLRLWKHVTLNSVGKDLFVRSTVNVIGDDLVIIGGGASCYAFGTKFSEPAKVTLLNLAQSHDELMPVKNQRKPIIKQNEGTSRSNIENSLGLQLEHAPNISVDESLSFNDNLPCLNDQSQTIALHYVLQLEKKYAKLGKDILKKFGWLDLGRKAYSEEGGVHICFPVHQEFFAVFHERKHHLGDAFDGKNEAPFSKPLKRDEYLLNELSGSDALTLLHEYGAIVLEDKIVEERKAAKSPLKVMTEAITSLVEHRGLPPRLLEELPARWDRLGDIFILPSTSFKDSMWDSIVEELWPIVAKCLKAYRLARQGPVAATGTRDSTLQILVGDNGWVNHRENGILYSFDATKCMFSWGNLSEKLRMARLDCKEEVVVDLFAGIGYFVLPFLVRAQAALVYACEWNPHAVEALQHNLQANSVADRCIILEGDNRITAPKSVADRVCLGLIPSSELSWVTAVRALRREGGILHIHGNTKDSEECQWIDHVSKSISDIARSEGYCWEVSIEHVERVKWYAPHIRHVVADVRCRQIQR
ncbi:tRNA wybutosine-synthesizing protein 2/3/4 [Cajanus cajan]|uniref:tRNA wybutosine-synthesizing protein 2/3/4 n=1 Tax=Cajanus cajan TaxID=3821 RepID=UPI00098DA437|nr:tRNA wybutosine-synthesizing protein 2/3/4 [Cajanus cajan]XP_020225984.1 tRNA wybutosine-synthesizing protein 2/3/4 [Cajanus cajan]